MNQRQKAFADFYIETHNAAEAARRAGYSPRSANQIGHENLTKPDIAGYIAERLSAQDEKRVAKADEVMAFFTAVMRGEIPESDGKRVYMADRLKAATELSKRYTDTHVSVNLPIIIDDVQ